VHGRPEERHRPLAGERRSHESECVAIEPARGGALSRDPSHNPRVVVDDRRCGRVTFPDSDGVESGDGWPKVSPWLPHLFARVSNR
jgi:hypothetical protein